MRFLRPLLLGLALLNLASQADDWPHWRGPHQDGISRETGWLTNWPAEGPAVLWRGAVGTGFSSFSVAAGRVFTMGNTQNTDTVFCFDAGQGNVLWQHSYPAPIDANLYEGGPNATPTVDGGRVFTLGKRGRLFCLEAATGKVVWEKGLVAELGVKKPEWGFASSPFVADNLLLLNVGDAGTAVDKATGKVVWTNGKGPAAYAAATPITRAGKAGAVFLAHRELVAVGVADGQVWWRLPWKTGYDMNAPEPALYEGKLLVASWEQPTALFDLSGGQPARLWQNTNFYTHVNTPLVIGHHAYGFHGDANKGREFKCLDLRTGQEAWSQPELVYGGVASAQGWLFVLTGKGELILAPASPEGFKPKAQAQILGGKCWTVPVLANGRLYARNARGDVVCLDLRPKP